MPPTQEIGPTLLHIPHKNWSPSDDEKQNYDEIERWSYRLPRGMLDATQRNDITHIPDNLATYEVLQSTKPINFEQGRQYKVTTQWPGMSGPVGNIVEFSIGLNRQPGAISGAQVFYPNSVFHIVQTNGPWAQGGNLFVFVRPTKSFNGPFLPGLWVAITTGAGPVDIYSATPGFHLSVVSLIVEDLGVVP